MFIWWISRYRYTQVKKFMQKLEVIQGTLQKLLNVCTVHRIKMHLFCYTFIRFGYIMVLDCSLALNTSIVSVPWIIGMISPWWVHDQETLSAIVLVLRAGNTPVPHTNIKLCLILYLLLARPHVWNKKHYLRLIFLMEKSGSSSELFVAIVIQLLFVSQQIQAPRRDQLL